MKEAVIWVNYLVKYNCVPNKYNSQGDLLTQFTEHLLNTLVSTEYAKCYKAYNIEKNDSSPSRVMFNRQA